MDLYERIRSTASEQFSRSGGPGGQNVNKVNTQVTLRIPVNELGLTQDQLARVREHLGNRINAVDELIIHCSETRSQNTNREVAVERAAALLSRAIRPSRKRRPTRPTHASRERRLQHKRARSEQKQRRRGPVSEE